MADKRIIENINKLKSLGMSDEDIVSNLINIGLSKEESELLVKDKVEEKKEDTKDDEIPTDYFTKKENKEKPKEKKEVEDKSSTENELEELRRLSRPKTTESLDFKLDFNDNPNDKNIFANMKDDYEFTKKVISKEDIKERKKERN